jgi:hypothetical protein
MYRFALALALAAPTLTAFAAGGGCSVAGTAFDSDGRPMQNAVVRLFDVQARRPTAFVSVGPDASFVFHDLNPLEYRVDIIGPPTVVTGSRLPRRSIWGMSQSVVCSPGQAANLDVRSRYGEFQHNAWAM